jgi:hypothetical protein
MGHSPRYFDWCARGKLTRSIGKRRLSKNKFLPGPPAPLSRNSLALDISALGGDGQQGRGYNWHMTPEHKWELVRTFVSIIPATALSAWALIHQRRQTKARLDVLISPIFSPTLDGQSLLNSDQLPGVIIRNQSPFPLRISNVGYRIGKRFYAFSAPPLASDLKPMAVWPFELAPRARLALYPNILPFWTELETLKSDLRGANVWDVGHAYCVTECGNIFSSRRLPRKTRKWLRGTPGQKGKPQGKANLADISD